MPKRSMWRVAQFDILRLRLIKVAARVDQDSPAVLRALAANTSIKMAARLEGSDRSTMARDMNTMPDFIRDQKISSFATFVRGEATRQPQNVL